MSEGISSIYRSDECCTAGGSIMRERGDVGDGWEI